MIMKNFYLFLLGLFSAMGVYAQPYAVNIAEAAGGVVSSDKATAVVGETVTLTVTPDAGYAVDVVKVIARYPITSGGGGGRSRAPRRAGVSYVSQGNISVTKVDDTHYTFTLPASLPNFLSPEYMANTEFYVTATFKSLPKYPIVLNTPTGGTLESDKAAAAIGETVTLTVTPDAGYAVDAVSVLAGYEPQPIDDEDFAAGYGLFQAPRKIVIWNSQGSIPVVQVDDTHFTFTLPEELPNDLNPNYLENTEFKVTATFVETEEPAPTEQTLTLGDLGVGTYASNYDLNFTGITGLKAYIASGFDPEKGQLVLTPVQLVPAGTGLYLKGTPGEYTIPVEATKFVYANLLVGVTEAAEVAPATATHTHFILADGNYGISFYTLSETGTIAAGKAYLSLPTGAVTGLANGIKLMFDDEQTTAIRQAADAFLEDGENGYYTLDGRRLNGVPTRKGVFIHHGKKVVVK